MASTIATEVTPMPWVMGLGNAPVSLEREYGYIGERFHITGSRLGQLDFRFRQLEKDVWNLGRLRDGWDSYGSPVPSWTARQTAVTVLRRIQTELLEPRGIGPSADGGVAIYFINGDRYAHLEILNSGEMAAVMYEGYMEPRTLDVPSTDQGLHGAIRAIKEYVE